MSGWRTKTRSHNPWQQLRCWLTRGTVGVFYLLMAGAAICTSSARAEDTAHYKAADTSSPRDTLRSFIDACNELDDLINSQKYFDRNDPTHLAIAEKVLDCIDDSELPGFARVERAGEAATCLKEILDRVDFSFDDAPDPWADVEAKQYENPIDQALAEEKAAEVLEKLTHYRVPDTRITIARVEEGPRKHEYLFSPGTVDRAVDYYDRMRLRPYRKTGPRVSPGLYDWFVSVPGNPWLGSLVDYFPPALRKGRTLGITNWKWPGLVIALLLSVVALACAVRAHLRYTEPARQKSLFLYWLTLAFPIFALLVPFAFQAAIYHSLTFRSTPLYIADFVAVLVAMLLALVVIFAASNRIAASVIASPYINPAGLNAQLIRIAAKLASLVFSSTVLLFVGQYLGIPIATLLASAGIGGVAVALGAQDTLKTLFGTINLLADKPFRVGDRIVINNYDGVVEDIGLRSSRLRLLNGHQVTLPNDQLAGNDIENIGRRPFIRQDSVIYIPVDTACAQLERAAEIIHEELDNHEGMNAERLPQVYFDEFTPAAFALRFTYWYEPPEYWRFKAFVHDLNFRIFRRFEAEGIQFSLPFRHSFWKQDDAQGPLDVRVIDANQQK